MVNGQKYSEYVERLELFDMHPTYEPTESYITPSSPFTTNNQDANLLQYIILVSFATSVLSSVCVICIGYYFIRTRNTIALTHLNSISSDSTSQSKDNIFEIYDIYSDSKTEENEIQYYLI